MHYPENYQKDNEIRDDSNFFYDEIKFIKREIKRLDLIPWDYTLTYCCIPDNTRDNCPTNDAKYYLFYYVEKDDSEDQCPPERLFYTGKAKTAKSVLEATCNRHLIKREFGPFIIGKKGNNEVYQISLDEIIKEANPEEEDLELIMELK
jgi:hypothetical protein